MRRLLVIMFCFIMLAFAGKANAAVWTEVGDAGALPGTAQVPSGVNPLTSISGSLIDSNDVDMYQIYLTDGVSFSATTVGGASFDTMLWLFNSAGNLVSWNDDDGALLQSTLGGTAAGGFYYLAISGYWYVPQPVDGFGLPIIGSTLTGWGDLYEGNYGPYSISLTGTDFVPASVPEPSTLLLLGSGLVGLAGFRRKFKK